MKRTDIMTVLGLVLGIGFILASILVEGNPVIFWSPSSIMITMGGSFAALLINFHLEQIKLVFRVTKQAFLEKKKDPQEIISFFHELAQKARREGLLALEDDIVELDDPFLRKGLQMMVDGMEPEIIKDILTTEVEAQCGRHKLGQELFRSWGALAPAFGMIGTLIGLIQMLVSLDDPSAIGPGMAVALITTFYGALFANLILIPMAGKLAIKSDEEVLVKGIMMDGILAIQSGINPRILEDKLKAYLAPGEREIKIDEPEKEYEEGVITDNA